MTRSRALGALVRRILVWHAAGIGLGTLGFGLSFFMVSLWVGAPADDLVFGALYSVAILAPMTLVGFIRLTPLAVATLALWTLSAWKFPALESGPRWRGRILLIATGCLLMVPIEIGLIAAIGASVKGTSETGIGLVGHILRQDAGATFVYLTTALGWFVAPRLLFPSLWHRFAGTPTAGSRH